MKKIRIAGPPGTGKTTKLVNIYYSHLKEYSPADIVVISHTNTAADHIRDRIQDPVSIQEYQKETGQNRANRSNFDNSVDFIGWYLSKASSVRIRNYEVDKLYLAYHEGYGGYKRRSYKDKDWLIDVAKKVKYNAVRYERQLKNCPLKEKRGFWDIF